MSTLATFQFAVAQADIALYNSGAAVTTWTNIPVVAESNIEYAVQKAEVADGEGALQHIWRHSQRATVTLRMKRFAFRILELLSGSPVSSAQGTDVIKFGVAEEINAPYVRLRLQQRAIDAAGTTGYTEAILFKCQGVLPPFTMRETTPGEYTVTFDALTSTKDENANTIPSALFKVTALKSSLA